ncbi:MAG: winged helix-turn-helix transcriptional regulator [Rhodobacteraceae bacterium]|jgi:DNA-binding winged helix-turn-helix (wHTH) protein|uniref:winged helix-turn-helix domain-containing protein n=1 Tax=Albidovulum sp. TaxID=1872424 RepID=UPI001D2DFF02|nr:winged helix-turn-helix domain-containing protein [uncultured Defluviimonas sp.]MCB2126733.1 winged helix-turn-helix transcriptional regulator [Paracoccaceae bacterium]MCC0071447.1 winged helix-turn-helix transcriptional regulator [Paracoccaceae bacterium]
MTALPSSFDPNSAVPVPAVDLSAVLSMIASAARPSLASRPQRAATGPANRAYPANRVSTSVRKMPGHQRNQAPEETRLDDAVVGAEWLVRSLLACIAAGVTGAATAGAPSESPRFPFGKACLHLDSARLIDADGTEIPLTAMEYQLLKLFALNRGRVLNRDQILEGAHDRSWDPFDRSIDIRISRIRKKIEVNPKKPEVIRTVRGIGYVYDPA